MQRRRPNVYDATENGRAGVSGALLIRGVLAGHVSTPAPFPPQVGIFCVRIVGTVRGLRFQGRRADGRRHHTVRGGCGCVRRTLCVRWPFWAKVLLLSRPYSLLLLIVASTPPIASAANRSLNPATNPTTAANNT